MSPFKFLSRIAFQRCARMKQTTKTKQSPQLGAPNTSPGSGGSCSFSLGTFNPKLSSLTPKPYMYNGTLFVTNGFEKNVFFGCINVLNCTMLPTEFCKLSYCFTILAQNTRKSKARYGFLRSMAISCIVCCCCRFEPFHRPISLSFSWFLRTCT